MRLIFTITIRIRCYIHMSRSRSEKEGSWIERRVGYCMEKYGKLTEGLVGSRIAPSLSRPRYFWVLLATVIVHEARLEARPYYYSIQFLQPLKKFGSSSGHCCLIFRFFVLFLFYAQVLPSCRSLKFSAPIGVSDFISITSQRQRKCKKVNSKHR